MKISDELKRNLIADVENICGVTLDEETKESLMRCFEITIGTHEPKFVLSDVSIAKRTFCLFPDICGFKGVKTKRCSYKGECEYKTKKAK